MTRVPKENRSWELNFSVNPIQVQIVSFGVLRAPFLGTTRILPWARLLIVILVDLAHFEPN